MPKTRKYFHFSKIAEMQVATMHRTERKKKQKLHLHGIGLNPFVNNAKRHRFIDS